MVPGFVSLGAVAVLFQVLVVGGLWAYLRSRRPVAPPATRRRVTRLVAGGVGLAAVGQLAALGAVGSLRVGTALSFEQTLLLQDAGLSLAALGYLLAVAGFVVHSRAGG